MADFLFAAAGFVLAMVALGLFRILHGPTDADRMMAAQLVGTGGVATRFCWPWQSKCRPSWTLR